MPKVFRISWFRRSQWLKWVSDTSSRIVYARMAGNKIIVWFRRDLRIEDNPALSAAARDGRVLPVFIWCPKEEGQFYPGRVSRWWLKHSLLHLSQSLKSLGSQLVLIKGDSTLAALLACIDSAGATRVVFNHLYDPISLVRDHHVKEKLVELGISVQSYNADLLYEPWEVYNEKGLAFTTFDAYWNKCMHMQMEPISHAPVWRLQPLPTSGTIGSCSIEDLGLEDKTERSSNELLGRGWSPGWGHADKALTEFVEHHLVNYAENRSKVVGNSTSLLSPYLHFGEVSVRKVFQSIRLKQILWVKEGNSSGEESATLYLRSIGLREYSRYLCFNFPFTHEKSLLSNLKHFPWCPDQTSFKAWRQGRTGYPLVDAGMRELWATGWIHNRIRVIVSSFAVKFLLLPWKWGMKYFWDTLLDADLESDILGWQYISGSLPDGHELERMDCPEVQGCKFDPEGEYVRQWLPELARMPTEWIHHPWDAPTSVLKASGVELGLNYPKPIIDVDAARARLTEAICKMWELEAAARSFSLNHADEVVGDNSEEVENSSIPKVVLKDRAPSFSISSNDQRVPASQNSKGGLVSKKRPKEVGVCEMRPVHENLQDELGRSTKDEEVCSTAESSAAKRQTISRDSFSVPGSRSSSNSVTSNVEEIQCFNLKQKFQEQVDIEHGTQKDAI